MLHPFFLFTWFIHFYPIILPFSLFFSLTLPLLAFFDAFFSSSFPSDCGKSVAIWSEMKGLKKTGHVCLAEKRRKMLHNELNKCFLWRFFVLSTLWRIWNQHLNRCTHTQSELFYFSKSNEWREKVASIDYNKFKMANILRWGNLRDNKNRLFLFSLNNNWQKHLVSIRFAVHEVVEQLNFQPEKIMFFTMKKGRCLSQIFLQVLFTVFRVSLTFSLFLSFSLSYTLK